jgi:hypothetical protein
MGDLLHVYGDDPDGPGWGKIEAFGGTPLGDVCPSCVVEQSQKLYPGLPETNDPAKGRRS